MPATINGSPTHVLIVHAVVVLLPLSVVASLVLVFVPGSRRAFGLLAVLVAFLGCLAVPMAFLSGSALRHRLPPSPLIDHHVALAHQLLPVAAVFGLSLAAFVAVDIVRRGREGQLNQVEHAALSRRPGLLRHGSSRAVRATYRTTAVLLVVMSVLTAVAVVRVGDSGAKAAWSHRLVSSPTEGTGSPR
jgi:amino acid transporter